MQSRVLPNLLICGTQSVHKSLLLVMAMEVFSSNRGDAAGLHLSERPMRTPKQCLVGHIRNLLWEGNNFRTGRYTDKFTLAMAGIGVGLQWKRG